MAIIIRLLPYAIVVALLAAHYFAGHKAGTDSANASWQTKWDAQVIELAQAKAHAIEIMRAEEKRRYAAIDEVRRDAQDEINRARADAIAADVAADSVREQAQRLAKSASRCTGNTTTGTRGDAASAPAVVLANVFSRSDQRAGELAKAYDEARARGLACQAHNKVVRGEQ